MTKDFLHEPSAKYGLVVVSAACKRSAGVPDGTWEHILRIKKGFGG